MARLFLKPASEGLYHHSYDPISITSLDFNRLYTSRVLECVPSDHFTDISGDGELQLAPQVFPPYGKVNFRTAAFFVPEHQIFSASEAWHNNQTMYKGRTFKLPVFKPYDVLNGFIASRNGMRTLVKTINESDPHDPDTDFPQIYEYDFIDIVNNNSTLQFNFYKLNATGYRYYSFFKQLGYDFVSPPAVFDASLPSGVNNRYVYCKQFCDYYRSALPLLAYAKVYADYFIPGQFFNGSNIVKLLQSVHDVADMTVGGTTWFTASTGVLEPVACQYIYNCKTPVAQDMYTSAWNSPNSPLGTNPSDYGTPNNGSVISPYVSLSSYDSNTVGQDQFEVFSSAYNRTPLNSINKFGLNILNSFFQFVMRNNLSGTRPVQRTLARFGIKPSDATSHFVTKIYESSDRIKFHPVLSNSSNQTNGTTDVGEGLGDIAGFSKHALNFSFEYKCSDYGYIIVVHWLQIKSIKLHGQDPAVMRLNPFDAFTPEYDGQALRAIPMCELSVQHEKRQTNDVLADLKTDEQIYGFTNLYDDYRELRDNVTGDFLNGHSQDFLFARDYSLFRSLPNMTMKPQSDDIQYQEGGGYTNPFQMSASVADRFWLGIQFDVQAERPIRTKSDALMLNGSGDTEIPLNGTLNS